MSALKIIVLFTALLASATAKIVSIQSCEEESDYMCKVNEVRASPCRGNHNCVIEKDTDASAFIDITPNFDSSKLKTTLYYTDGIIEVPLGTTDNDGSSFAGTFQTLSYYGHISIWQPAGTFHLKCKIWNAYNKEEFCCFKTTVVLKNPWF